MSCTACGTQYNIFTREHGCGNCGFSFCSKCVQNKIPVPKLNGSKHHVCSKCYKALQSKETKTEKEYSPPAVLQRRLEALENPSQPPITVYYHNPRTSRLRHGLSQEDQEIVDRLERLKEDRKKQPVPSEDEMAVRLARLKDMDPNVYVKQSTSVYHTPDNRSAAAQSSDLMKQIQEEVELDKKIMHPVDDIAKHFAHLSSQEAASYSQSNDLNRRPHSMQPAVERSSTEQQTANLGMDMDEASALLAEASHQVQLEAQASLAEIEKDKELQKRVKELQLKDKNIQKKGEEDDEDEKEEVDKVLEKLLSEASLDEATADIFQSTRLCGEKRPRKNQGFTQTQQQESGSSDSDELPWCGICNEDANVRCADCDGDLYCSSCFEECHSTLDMEDHKSIPFKQKKKETEV